MSDVNERIEEPRCVREEADLSGYANDYRMSIGATYVT
jgi:hypothetical protein